MASAGSRPDSSWYETRMQAVRIALPTKMAPWPHSDGGFSARGQRKGLQTNFIDEGRIGYGFHIHHDRRHKFVAVRAKSQLV